MISGPLSDTQIRGSSSECRVCPQHPRTPSHRPKPAQVLTEKTHVTNGPAQLRPDVHGSSAHTVPLAGGEEGGRGEGGAFLGGLTPDPTALGQAGGMAWGLLAEMPSVFVVGLSICCWTQVEVR